MAHLAGMTPAHFTIPQRTLRGLGDGFDFGTDPYASDPGGGYSALPPGTMDGLSDWLAAPNAILPMVSNLAFGFGAAILVFYLANKDSGHHGRRR